MSVDIFKIIIQQIVKMPIYGQEVLIICHLRDLARSSRSFSEHYITTVSLAIECASLTICCIIK